MDRLVALRQLKLIIVATIWLWQPSSLWAQVKVLEQQFDTSRLTFYITLLNTGDSAKILGDFAMDQELEIIKPEPCPNCATAGPSPPITLKSSAAYTVTGATEPARLLFQPADPPLILTPGRQTRFELGYELAGVSMEQLKRLELHPYLLVSDGEMLPLGGVILSENALLIPVAESLRQHIDQIIRDQKAGYGISEERITLVENEIRSLARNSGSASSDLLQPLLMQIVSDVPVPTLINRAILYLMQSPEAAEGLLSFFIPGRQDPDLIKNAAAKLGQWKVRRAAPVLWRYLQSPGLQASADAGFHDALQTVANTLLVLRDTGALEKARYELEQQLPAILSGTEIITGQVLAYLSILWYDQRPEAAHLLRRILRESKNNHLVSGLLDKYFKTGRVSADHLPLYRRPIADRLPADDSLLFDSDYREQLTRQALNQALREEVAVLSRLERSSSAGPETTETVIGAILAYLDFFRRAYPPDSSATAFLPHILDHVQNARVLSAVIGEVDRSPPVIARLLELITPESPDSLVALAARRLEEYRTPAPADVASLFQYLSAFDTPARDTSSRREAMIAVAETLVKWNRQVPEVGRQALTALGEAIRQNPCPTLAISALVRMLVGIPYPESRVTLVDLLVHGTQPEVVRSVFEGAVLVPANANGNNFEAFRFQREFIQTLDSAAANPAYRLILPTLADSILRYATGNQRPSPATGILGDNGAENLPNSISRYLFVLRQLHYPDFQSFLRKLLDQSGPEALSRTCLVFLEKTEANLDYLTRLRDRTGSPALREAVLRHLNAWGVREPAGELIRQLQQEEDNRTYARQTLAQMTDSTVSRQLFLRLETSARSSYPDPVFARSLANLLLTRSYAPALPALVEFVLQKENFPLAVAVLEDQFKLRVASPFFARRVQEVLRPLLEQSPDRLSDPSFRTDTVAAIVRQELVSRIDQWLAAPAASRGPAGWSRLCDDLRSLYRSDIHHPDLAERVIRLWEENPAALQEMAGPATWFIAQDPGTACHFLEAGLPALSTTSTGVPEGLIEQCCHAALNSDEPDAGQLVARVLIGATNEALLRLALAHTVTEFLDVDYFLRNSDGPILDRTTYRFPGNPLPNHDQLTGQLLAHDQTWLTWMRLAKESTKEQLLNFLADRVEDKEQLLPVLRYSLSIPALWYTTLSCIEENKLTELVPDLRRIQKELPPDDPQRSWLCRILTVLGDSCK